MHLAPNLAVFVNRSTLHEQVVAKEQRQFQTKHLEWFFSALQRNYKMLLSSFSELLNLKPSLKPLL